MTTTMHKDSRFLAALTRFETCLETPIVPGELAAWLRDANESCDQVAALLRQEIEESHGRILRHIVREDLALAVRVEELTARDQELLSDSTALQSTLGQIRQKADQSASPETQLSEPVASWTQKALEFVIEARKQEMALTTWYTEALQRDRGEGD